MSDPADPFPAFYAALEARHRAELTFPEVRRALQALSSLYVERRERMAGGGALEGRGKRAAFALYYGAMHFLLVREVVRALGAGARGAAPRARPRLRHGNGRRGLGARGEASRDGRGCRRERLGRGRDPLDAGASSGSPARPRGATP